MRRALLGAVLLAGCTSDPELALGGFVVRWTEEPPSLTVEGAGGREFLRSTGAFLEHRTTSAEWESSFGSYRVTEGDEPWSGAPTRLRVEEREDDRVVLVLEGTGGETTLTVTSARPGQLDLVAQTPAGANRVRAQFACGETDRFLGFGGQSDAVDHRGHKLPIWVSEPGIGKTDEDEPTHTDWMLRGARHGSSYPLPTFLSNRGFAFLADTTRRSVFDVCKADPATWSVEAWDGAVTLRVFDGPAPATALERLTTEIGRQPAANDLALAPWNDAIFGSENVRRIAKLLRDERIPSGLIWTEDFRGGEWEGDSYRLLEEWEVDRHLYPDVEQLAADLHAWGFRFAAYHNTFLVSGTRVAAEASAAGVTVKDGRGAEYSFTGVKFTPTALIDLTHPQATSFVRTRLAALLALGFDGWMADFAEWLPPDGVLASGDAEALHNEYPRAYHELSTGTLASAANPAWATAFARSGTLRAAPHQPVVWAGDQATTFDRDDGMPTVVTMGLNYGLAGISTYGHDVAGYQTFGVDGVTRELFFRWTTLGALSPVMRTHHGTAPQKNWWFGKDEETLAHFRRWSRLHARLWPYLKLASIEAAQRGLPIMRHLALAHPDDTRMWGVEDAYLFGPSLYVAPVLVQGATAREATLPAGRWLGWDGGAPIEGGATRTFDVPLTEAVLLASAGSIVPMLPDTLDTLAPADPPYVDLDDVRGHRVLVVFAGAAGTTTDLDGTRYELSSASNEAPTSVEANGAALPACSEGGPSACVTVDVERRRAEVRGAALTDVAFRTAAVEVAHLRVTGSLSVDGVVLRW